MLMLKDDLDENESYIEIPIDFAQRKDLTYEAKGMFAELLSRSKDGRLIRGQLIKKHTRSTKITRILKELQIAGYLYIQTIRKDGKINDRIWKIDYDKLFDRCIGGKLPKQKRKVTDLLKNQVCIYFLYKNNVIVYVGQTTKGVSRILKHGVDKNFDAYAFLPCKKKELDILENKYIRMLDPEYNKAK